MFLREANLLTRNTSMEINPSKPNVTPNPSITGDSIYFSNTPGKVPIR
jgi:hypothetical protein